MLLDAHQRIINYVRLSVTDRCNLRCTYCMPANMRFLNKIKLLTDDEIIDILSTLASAGVSKVRITGGEPFLRPGLIKLLERISYVDGITNIAITTNGVLTREYIPALKSMGINHINLSLDSLQPERFKQITRRDSFTEVMNTLDSLVLHNMNIKINMVVMDQLNTAEINDFVALTRDQNISVRFIEEMPFNGQGNGFSGITWHYKRIMETIAAQYALNKMADEPNSTSFNYQILGHKGNIGVIPAYSRTFCGTCNRLRISATGSIKTCLYGNDVLNLKPLLQQQQPILPAIINTLKARYIDGFTAEKHSTNINKTSMSVIGG
ncbi:GTP 3',8-cyclase MoaA [Chitinophaga silvatica]|uniref:GTP 3',8-cyclase n=1 Tax=Chitinophaga silvatica TaxID=2282649 RepID=A0A3E1YA42_9BACT|nr:GTP 3',8-cyclase MoaA [Chitinophaga silvatica]RFS22614.1 GTP 3',8-cyclase MoaA [Chitinophaga silvatica]